jgi:thiol-disulfide isomerase/thioredoxin
LAANLRLLLTPIAGNLSAVGQYASAAEHETSEHDEEMSLRSALCLAALVTTLGACGPGTSSSPSADLGTPGAVAASAAPTATLPVTSSPKQTKSAAQTAATVPETLRFSGTTVDGKPFDGASLAGKPVLLWFWAPWCPICRGQISQVDKIAADHGGSLSVVGVGSLDDANAIRGFTRNASGVTHLVDESGDIWKHFRVKEQSSFVLLDASGDKVFSSGYGGSDELNKRVADVVR